MAEPIRYMDKEAQARWRAVKAAERAIIDDGGEDAANRRSADKLLERLELHHPDGDAYAR